ncbi:amidohydrolase family protein [Alteromonas sp. D210916BOD_24]|uniref:amidohydrolase family protein n=1 Tax=Alteromonas sp. D210916BOD_24 TaxID=3157618 RepID=UPI00399C6904
MRKLAVLIASLSVMTSAVADNYAIVGGKIHTMTPQGIIEGGSVLISDGRIESISKSTEVPEGYQHIDATGKVVTPGFIGALTSLGLVEVSSSSGVVDASIEKTPVSNTGAALDVQYAINPDSSLLAITRLEGMTAAATAITSSHYLFGGLGAVIKLSGQTPLLKSSAFMTIDVGGEGAEHTGGSRAALWVMLDKLFDEANKASTSMSAEKPWYGLNSRLDVKALKRVLSGEVPLLMRADRAADIRQVIAFKDRHPSVKVVLVHGVEAWRVADELAEASIPVVIDPEYNLPGGFDQMGATLSNAARLHQAGVRVAIGMDTHNIRLAAQHAGNAVANGLPHEAGLESLTLVPAEIFGLSDKVGSLKAGNSADIVIWSGDPLEVTEAAEAVFIDGAPVKLESRQTRLRDRYLSLGKSGNAVPSHYQRGD